MHLPIPGFARGAIRPGAEPGTQVPESCSLDDTSGTRIIQRGSHRDQPDAEGVKHPVKAACRTTLAFTLVLEIRAVASGNFRCAPVIQSEMLHSVIGRGRS